MGVELFLKNFEEQFDDVDSNSLSLETQFRNIPEWSSLTVLMIISMFDSEYDIAINGDDIKKSVTIDDLHKLILKNPI